MTDTEGSFYGGEGMRPIPDPTLLTTRQLNREIGALKEVVFTRLDGMDKALEVFTSNLNRVPSDVDKQVSGLKQLIYERIERVEERFKSITIQFAEQEKRQEQASRNASTAVEAALQAAKDAVNAQNTSNSLAIAKSEAATAKSIDTIQLLIQTAIATLDGKIDDVKERLTRIEGQATGETTAQRLSQTDQQNTVGIIGLIAGALIGVAGVVVAIMALQTPDASVVVGPPKARDRVIIEQPE